MNLFIDTNVYLRFYAYGDDDLEEMRKLLSAIAEKAVHLFITPQVIREFNANRENVIANTIKDIEKPFSKTFPRIIHHYEEYAALREHLRTTDKLITVIGKKVREQAKKKQLKADEVVNLLFEKAITIEESSDIFSQAERRHSLRLPPGKDNSLGDSINWESLLNNLPDNADLHIVTGDSDYISTIDSALIKSYLSEEWKEKKKSEILYYSSLSDFFGKHFPDIKLSVEIERKIRMDKFIDSGSFISTHSAIEKLSPYIDSFSDEEVNKLISAAIGNPQINRIYSDPDVRTFIEGIVGRYADKIDSDSMSEIATWYAEPDVDIP